MAYWINIGSRGRAVITAGLNRRERRKDAKEKKGSKLLFFKNHETAIHNDCLKTALLTYYDA